MRRRTVIALLGSVFMLHPTRAVAQSAARLTLIEIYSSAVNDFRSVLTERRGQIDARKQLPNLPGQGLYLARNKMLSAYKDVTDEFPTRIGRANKFGIPAPYFDADNEPLLDEYYKLIDLMESPRANAQYSDTPLKDVVDLATAIGRAKGLSAVDA